jgi:hypothetical protein
MALSLEWKLSNAPLADIGFAIANSTTEVANQQVADLAELFPLKSNWEIQGHIDEEWLIVRITERYGSGVPTVGELKGDELDYIKRKVLPFKPRLHSELFALLGSDWFSFQRFTYVGPYRDSYACWPDLNQHLIDWLNHIVLPEVFKRNEKRILRAIPKPPQFNLESIRRACWVLECEESLIQGTAFYLKGTGFVTCKHVLGTKTVAFQPDNISNKYPVTVIAQNETIDAAILSIDQELPHGLSAGSANNLKVMDHVAVAGFPNYRYGDTGVIIPGLIVGFRMVSGIRRILTNAPIVAGSSGGPVVGGDNHVIGIAVTGAEMMDRVQETENHGIIPIDALNLIKIDKNG